MKWRIDCAFNIFNWHLLYGFGVMELPRLCGICYGWGLRAEYGRVQSLCKVLSPIRCDGVLLVILLSWVRCAFLFIFPVTKPMVCIMLVIPRMIMLLRTLPVPFPSYRNGETGRNCVYLSLTGHRVIGPVLSRRGRFVTFHVTMVSKPKTTLTLRLTFNPNLSAA